MGWNYKSQSSRGFAKIEVLIRKIISVLMRVQMLYQKAAEQEYADVEFYLSKCYTEGRGIAMNMDEAMRW